MTIDKDSPFYQFANDSIGWLLRRNNRGEEVLNEDVARIIEVNLEVISDPVVRDYVVRGLRGELKAKRGRKRGHTKMLKEAYAVALYDNLLPRLQARRERQKSKGIRKSRADYASAEFAQAIIARRIGMKTPEGVRNLISSLKNK